jgi:predicted acetyltransferase
MIHIPGNFNFQDFFLLNKKENKGSGELIFLAVFGN